MKLKYTILESPDLTGDFSVEYYINGVNVIDCPLNTLKQVLHALIDKDNNLEVLEAMFEMLVRDLGETTSKEEKMLVTNCEVEL